MKSSHFDAEITFQSEGRSCHRLLSPSGRQGALRRKSGATISSVSSGPAERGSIFSPCRQRTTTCRDKMALYNFKKITVVPTAKVSFFSFFNVLNRCCVGRVIVERWETEEDIKNMVGLWWEGTHVLSCAGRQQRVSICPRTDLWLISSEEETRGKEYEH